MTFARPPAPAEPNRTCIGCRRVAPQSELVRVVRTVDGDVVIGRTAPGRGAWLCSGSIECLDAAVKRKAFGRALKGPVSTESLALLREALQQDVRG